MNAKAIQVVVMMVALVVGKWGHPSVQDIVQFIVMVHVFKPIGRMVHLGVFCCDILPVRKVSNSRSFEYIHKREEVQRKRAKKVFVHKKGCAI